MLVDITKPMTNLDGKPIQQDGKDMLLKDVIILACLASIEEEQKKITPDKATARWRLAMDCHLASGEVDIPIDLVKDIRERIPKLFAVVVAGQACELLK